ncbi:hypothetical protein SDC9_182487 [bioreactor metagenome]|uniref:Lipoprotein n=1 Tax=bioreactor metagenome TaxID=1076179 RepID=A0A645HH46_9ZZZZ
MKRIAALALAVILSGTFFGCEKSPVSQPAGGPAAGTNETQPAGADLEKLCRMLPKEGKCNDAYVEAMKIVELVPDNEEAYRLAGYGTDQLYCAEQLLIFPDINDNSHQIRMDLGNGNITPLVEK